MVTREAHAGGPVASTEVQQPPVVVPMEVTGHQASYGIRTIGRLWPHRTDRGVSNTATDSTNSHPTDRVHTTPPTHHQ